MPNRKGKLALPRILEGTIRPRRPRNEGSRPVSGMPPKPPSWLSAEAKAKWRELAAELHRRGLLTRLDRSMLAVLCVAFAEWKAAVQLVQWEGAIYEQGGLVRQHPASTIAQTLAKDLLGFCTAFGMTPSAREELSGALPDSDNTPA